MRAHRTCLFLTFLQSHTRAGIIPTISRLQLPSCARPATPAPRATSVHPATRLIIRCSVSRTLALQVVHAHAPRVTHGAEANVLLQLHLLPLSCHLLRHESVQEEHPRSRGMLQAWRRAWHARLHPPPPQGSLYGQASPPGQALRRA